MLRLLNIVAVLALLASAAYAYLIKYETMLFSAQLGKVGRMIARERVVIGQLRAEWAWLTRPERIQTLAERHLTLEPRVLPNIVRWRDVPERAPAADTIGHKLDALGLGVTTSGASGVGPGVTTAAPPAKSGGVGPGTTTTTLGALRGPLSGGTTLTRPAPGMVGGYVPLPPVR